MLVLSTIKTDCLQICESTLACKHSNIYRICAAHQNGHRASAGRLDHDNRLPEPLVYGRVLDQQSVKVTLKPVVSGLTLI